MPPASLPMPPAPAVSDLRPSSPPATPALRPSFPKRHASFDSPCQVPLPSPTPSASKTRFHDSYFPASPSSPPASPPASPPSSSPSSSHHFPVFDDSDSKSTTSASSLASPPTTLATPIFPFQRPFSLPPPHDEPSARSDRFSSASLPLPHNVPFQTLPRAPSPPADPAAHAARVRQAHRSEVAADTSRPRSPLHSVRPPSPSPSLAVSYPAPDPPTILAPEVSPGPFLSHAPPPPDSWIQVETSTSEYKLNVRLPGFKRDGITLATKKRRVLHVVADCWENGGGQSPSSFLQNIASPSPGHFERRISFGYDADLVQVRAEFDGEMLRISIPRRLPPVDLLRPAPLGRTS
ncbi:hypothetical protein C0995_010400 [Termitomyces sp. Mi166|nr:hypothetical protein C0995_010400 [Termitomyces sp. Mi166\